MSEAEYGCHAVGAADRLEIPSVGLADSRHRFGPDWLAVELERLAPSKVLDEPAAIGPENGHERIVCWIHVFHPSDETRTGYERKESVSIASIETKVMDGVYIVTAHATVPDGRTDASTGAITIKGLQGDNLCNAMMKAETKAKRRVTLSICGLGFNDESEMDSLKDARKVNFDAHLQAANHQKNITQQLNHDQIDLDFVDFMASINQSEDETQLKTVFDEIKKANFKAKPDLFKKLIEAKDKRKSQLVQASIIQPEELSSVDEETGEVNE